MAGTLREELASLKIDRPDSIKSAERVSRIARPAPRRWRSAVALVDVVADSAGTFGGWRRLWLSSSTIRCGRGPW